MKIDDAAAAFRAASHRYTIEPMPDTSTYRVREDDGTLHGEGNSHDDAITLAQQLAGRDGVEAVLREMISPETLMHASQIAGVTIRKCTNNSVNMGRRPALALLEGIIRSHVRANEREQPQQGTYVAGEKDAHPGTTDGDLTPIEEDTALAEYASGRTVVPSKLDDGFTQWEPNPEDKI